MQVQEIRNIFVHFPDDMSYNEACHYVDEAIHDANSRLVELYIDIDANDNIILTHKYDSIVRLRRITGYLSNTKNFNDAKQAEQASRTVHLGGGEIATQEG